MSEVFDLCGLFDDMTGPDDGFSGYHFARMRKSGSFDVPFSWLKFMDDSSSVVFDQVNGQLVLFDCEVFDEDGFVADYRRLLGQFSQRAAQQYKRLFRHIYPVSQRLEYSRAAVNPNVFSFPDSKGYLGDVPVNVTLEGRKHFGIIKPSGDLWAKERADINLEKALFVGCFCETLFAAVNSKTPVQKFDTTIHLSGREQNQIALESGGVLDVHPPK
jgi:hypothetical protein